MIKVLYVTDLDGTLLHPDAVISDRTYEILSDELEKGLPLTVATARTDYSVLPILRGLPFRLPMILQNGAMLFDPVNKRILHAACIAPDAYTSVCDCLSQCGINGFAYCIPDDLLNCCYTELTTAHMQQFYQERKNRYDKPFRQVQRLTDIAEQKPVYVTVNAPQVLLDPLAKMLESVKGISVSYYRDVYRTEIWYLEISAPDATKYHGVQRLREIIGAETVVGFGDNRNDLPLFAACDDKIAVSNAAPELKAQADRVIGANTEDAVAVYLRSISETTT